MSKLTKSSLIIIFIILCDQVLKIWIKTNMFLGQEYNVIGDWFKIHFIENPGMAFGLQLGGDFGKLFLSLFRIVAVFVIGWYIIKLSKKEVSFGLLFSISLIFAGAVGNIIDSAFYGLIFSNSNMQIATFLPEGGGYASFLHGKVVDMLYFPLVESTYPSWFPEWFPLKPGSSFTFFRPVFNIADSAITSGIFIILVFQRKYLRSDFSFRKKEPAEVINQNADL